MPQQISCYVSSEFTFVIIFCFLSRLLIVLFCSRLFAMLIWYSIFITVSWLIAMRGENLLKYMCPCKCENLLIHVLYYHLPRNLFFLFLFFLLMPFLLWINQVQASSILLWRAYIVSAYSSLISFSICWCNFFSLYCFSLIHLEVSFA